MRTHFSILPTLTELKQIMKKEAPRSIGYGKESTHYADFTSIIKLMNYFALPTTYFVQELTLSDLETDKHLEIINRIANELADHILQSPAPIEIYTEVYDYLAETDADPKPSDILFVFGAKTEHRIEKTIALYQAGLGKKIWISGGNPHYDPAETSEAEKYQTLALQAGVRAEDIFIETQSITIPDNVGTSLNEMRKQKINPQSITLINSPYSQRRGWCVFKKHTSDQLLLQRVNCETGPNYSRENWFKNEAGINVIFNEFVKLKIAVILNTA